MGSVDTIAVLLNEINCYAVIDASVKYWAIAMHGCLVVNDAYEQSKEENDN